MKKILFILFIFLSCIGLGNKNLFDPSSEFGLFLQSNLCSVLKICPPKKPPSETSRDLTSFLFSVPPVFGLISDSKVNIVVPFFTDRTKLKAGFTHNGSRIDVNGVVQESGLTENNFTTVQKYRVTARDGNSRIYDVEVKNASASSKELMSFGFVNPNVTGFITGDINSAGAIKITVGVPFGTSVTNLVAKFTSIGNSIHIGGTPQIPGVTGNNFSSPVTYTVVAADGTTKSYEVTVEVGGTDSKDILSFGFLSLGVTGTITGTNINLILPAGISAFNQIPFFTTNGKTVKVSGAVQISNSTPIDFSSPVIYTVEANDGSTKNYTVTVNVSTGSDKEMVSFSIPSAGATSTITTSASSGTINLRVPPNSNLTNTVALFQISGVNAYINEREQISGQTFNNFSNPPTYTVIAQDGSRKRFNIIITENITVNISGLTANGLGLFNGVSTTNVAAGQTSASMGLDASNGNRIRITTQPTGQVCAFNGNSSGNLSAENPTVLNITCINGFLYAGKILPYDPATRQPLDTAVNFLNLIAGTGSPGNADSPTGASATFNGPSDIKIIGNFAYVVDGGNHAIRRISLTSPYAVTTIAGGGIAGANDGIGPAARFNLPTGISTDGANLYITDYNNYSIRKLDLSNNEVTTIAGTSGQSGSADGVGSAARFFHPTYSTYHDGNLYISDSNYINFSVNTGKIRKLSLATRTVTTLVNTLQSPQGITNDGTNIYFVDWENNRINKINIATGVMTVLAGSGNRVSYDGVGTAAQFNWPWGIDIEGNFLYVTEIYNNDFSKLRKINLTTNRVETFFRGGILGTIPGDTFTAQMQAPNGIFINGKSIYLTARFGHRIFELKPADNSRYYPLAGNANEATNTGFNGTVPASVTPARNHNGVAGGALRFDGTASSFIRLPDTGLPSGSSKRTMCAWINAEQLPPGPTNVNDQFVIVSYGGSTLGTRSYLGLFRTNPGVQKILFASSGAVPSSENTDADITIPLNTWVHICGSLNSGTAKIYFNGKEIVSQTGKTFNTTLGGGLEIGRQINMTDTVLYFKGKIADVRIYDRALSAGEVGILATNIPEGLVANFPFTSLLSPTVLQEDDIWFNRIDMTNVSGVTFLGNDRFGQPSSHGNFNGTTQYLINSATTNLLPAGNSPRTICNWIRPTGPALSDGTFKISLSYGSMVETYGQGLYNPPGLPLTQVNTCTQLPAKELFSPYEVNGVSAIYDGPSNSAWHHLCSTHDGNTMSQYVNGSLISPPHSRTLATDTSQLIIGAQIGGPLTRFQGDIDDVRIYNRVLSLEEIRTLASPTKRIFITASPTNGAMGGIAGADTKCNTDSARPDLEKIYKALIVDGTGSPTRTACTSADCTDPTQNKDWVLRPNTTYYQPHNSPFNSYPMFITNNAGISPPPGNLLNNLHNLYANPWTGINGDWTSDSNHCSSWTSAGGNGRVGWWAASSTTVSLLIRDGSNPVCSNPTFRLICVEQ